MLQLFPDRCRRLPSAAQTLLLFYNPGSGAADRRTTVMACADQLRQAGYDLELITDFAKVQSRVTELHPAGQLRAVIAAGGDGTLHGLVNYLPATVPFIGIPLGTENLLAKYLDWRADPELLVQRINAGYTCDFDAGEANGRVFLVTLSIGIDADVVQRLHAVREGHITHWSYVWPIVKSVAEYEFPTLTLEMLQPAQPPIQLRWVFINNFPCYAGGLQFTPQGKPDDRLLDLAGMTNGSLWEGLHFLWETWSGRLEHSANAVLQQFAELRLSAPSQQPVPFQLDGDPGGVLPLQVRILPQRFRAIVDQQLIAPSVTSHS
jgi:diacylglycerol kinase (ATP)